MAQSISLRLQYLGLEEGLSESLVHHIIQDQQDFMWFATQDGLNRFDGYQFKVYRSDPKDPFSLADSYINSMFERASGDLWVSMSTLGVNRYDRAADHFIYYGSEQGLASMEVKTFYETKDGHFWVGHNLGIQEFKNDQFTAIIKVPSPVLEITASSNDTGYWLGTEQGLFFYEKYTGRVVSFQEKVTKARVSEILIQDNTLWVASHDGLYFCDESGKIKKQYDLTRFGHQTTAIQTLCLDSFGYLWVGTQGAGLLRFDPQLELFFKVEAESLTGPSLDRVYQLYESKDKVLWIGSAGGIAYYDLNRPPFYNYYAKSKTSIALSDPHVWAIYRDQDHGLWVGTENGLNYLKPEAEHFKVFRKGEEGKGLSSNWVTAIVEDPKGENLWFGTRDKGLTKMNKTTGKTHFYNETEGIASQLIRTMLWDHQGYLWIGAEAGLNRIDVAQDTIWTFRNDPEQESSLSNNLIRAMLVDNGYLWIGSRSGFGRVQLDQVTEKNLAFEKISKPKGTPGALPHEVTLALKMAYDLLWVGTRAGLVKVHPDFSIQTYTRQKGFPNDIVYRIETDNHGSLWLSTNRGLCQFNVAEETFRNFDMGDGLQSNEFNFGSSFVDRDGIFYFGGTRGMSYFTPKEIGYSNYQPNIVLTDFIIFDKRKKPFASEDGPPKAIEVCDQVVLNADHKMVTFKFSALHYSNPKRNRYAYKLEGFTDSWIDVAEDLRQATFTNLDPKTYTFRVRGSNKDGIWSPHEVNLTLIVKPPWWQTPLAFILYGLCFLLLFALILIDQQKRYRIQRAVNERLVQVDKLKDDFLANTSHELRTPLNGIIGLSESLLEGVAGKVEPEVSHNLEMIVSSGKRLSRLVNDLLDFSKMKNRGLILDKQMIDLCSMVNVVISLSKPLIGQKNLQLVNEVDEDVDVVMADENRLQQILHNLIENAIKFTDEGSVVVSAKSDHEFLKVSVTDTGIGIPKHLHERIFEWFDQADDSSIRDYSGTGLGLAITLKLVELHGGTIWVTSTPDIGSTFTFSLPLVSPAENHKATPTQQDTRTYEPSIDTKSLRTKKPERQDGSGQFHILVVDDEPVNRQVLVNFLSLLEYRISEAANGQEALDLIFGQERFDMVLLDVMMPRISGYEVCRKIRESHPVQELPIIFLTAKSQAKDMMEGFYAGANDFLNKPITKGELLSRVRTHLQLLDINRNLETKVIERTRSMKVLGEIGQHITSSLDMTQILERVHRMVNDLMDAHTFGIGLYVPEHNRFDFKLVIEDGKRLPPFELSLNETNQLAIWCVLNRKEVIINQTSEVANYVDEVLDPKVGSPTHSVIYQPLLVADRLVGALTVQSMKPFAYSPYQQDIIRTIASYTAIAIDNSHSYREAEEKRLQIVKTQEKLVMQEKMASLGTLTAGIAHEINNPASFTRFGAQNMARDLEKFKSFLFKLAGDADDEILHVFNDKFVGLNNNLRNILEGTERISLIVTDLRSFTRLDEAERKVVRITDNVRSTLNLVGTQYKEKVIFSCDFQCEPELDCYPSQLNQVFMNLIVNGCQAIIEKHQGEKEQGSLTISSYEHEDWLFLTFQDTGIGMNQHVTDHIFEPFFTTKGVGEGTGLGLSISYGIVSRHGGKIEVTSTPGEGSTFVVKLPLT